MSGEIYFFHTPPLCKIDNTLYVVDAFGEYLMRGTRELRDITLLCIRYSANLGYDVVSAIAEGDDRCLSIDPRINQ